MKVFVAGATGVLGHRTVTALLSAGAQVSAIARTPEKAARVDRQGATPAEVSLFDRDALSAASVSTARARTIRTTSSPTSTGASSAARGCSPPGSITSTPASKTP